MPHHPLPRWIPIVVLPTWSERVDVYDADGRLVSTRVTDSPPEPVDDPPTRPDEPAPPTGPDDPPEREAE